MRVGIISIVERYNGIDIELWHIPNVGYIYHALIKERHEFFDRCRDARIQITIGGKG